jgi:hypothetical protein
VLESAHGERSGGNMINRVTTLLVATLLFGLSMPAMAADEPESRFSGVFQLDVTNAYFFRGILQEREGVQLQPWTELYYNLYSADDEDDFLQSVTIGGGTWLSFQSERTGATEDPQWLYETDYYPLLSLGFANDVSLTTIYYFYTSPNGAFSTVQELNFKLAWDDSDALGAWSMKPWVNVAWEQVNTSFGPNNGGVGLQVGFGPTLYAAEDESFTLTAPIEAGFSIDDYYDDESGDNHGFGYASAGLLASIPLTFVPEGAGDWTFSLSGKYFFFNEILEEANRGRGTYPVGMASLGVAF